MGSYVIAIFGGDKLIGKALIERLNSNLSSLLNGRSVEIIHIVKPLSPILSVVEDTHRTVILRSEYTEDDHNQLECCDAVINIASDSQSDETVHSAEDNGTPDLDAGSWEEHQKLEFLLRDLRDTNALVSGILHLKNPPKMFINCYDCFIGDTEQVTNLSMQHFEETYRLQQIQRDFQRAASRLSNVSTVVNISLSLLLSARGGFFSRLYRACLRESFDRIGTGSQTHSYITEVDAVNVIISILSGSLTDYGEIRLASSETVRNTELIQIIRSNLGQTNLIDKKKAASRDAERFVSGHLPQALVLGSTTVSNTSQTLTTETLTYPSICSALDWLKTELQRARLIP